MQRVSCAAAAWFASRSCCRWLPGPWAALPGLQLFAGHLLQRVQLFAARLMQLLQLFAAWFALPGGCRALPGPWSACLVPVAAGRPGRAAAAWCLDLVPVAAWSRVGARWPCLCLCCWSVRVCDPVPRFTNTRAALPGPRSVARVPGCLVRGHRSARPGP